MIVRIVSYLPDFGNFVMKSIAIVWNGSPFTGAMGNIVGFKGWVLILLAWQAAHPLTYCLALLQSDYITYADTSDCFISFFSNPYTVAHVRYDLTTSWWLLLYDMI